MEQLYVLTESDLRRLVEAEAVLNALEAGGVDNWDWYGDSINDALNGTGYETVSDFVEYELMPTYMTMPQWFATECEKEDAKNGI